LSFLIQFIWSTSRIKERSAPCSVPVLKTMKEPEIIRYTVSDDGSSNDGYRWRKYGQKMLEGEFISKVEFALLLLM